MPTPTTTAPTTFTVGNSPTVFTSQDAARQQAADMQTYFGAKPSEVSVLSSDGGRDVLNKAIDDHNNLVAGIGSSNSSGGSGTGGGSTVTTDKNDATSSAMKSIGGVTADEAKAAGIDLSGYTYDPGSKYFLPNNGTKTQQDQFASDKKSINDAFSGLLSKMDDSTMALINSIKGVYNDRIAVQQDINKRELQSFNTTNIRQGTDRYAPGVAQSILTADENEGLKRIAAIENEMMGKISEAQSNLDNKKYQAFLDNRKEIQTLTSEYKSTLQTTQQRALDAAKEARVRQQKLDDDLTAAKSDALKTVMKSGAPQSVIDKIKAATTVQDTVSAMAGYTGKNLAAEKLDDGKIMIWNKDTGKVENMIDPSAGPNGPSTPSKSYDDFLIGRTPQQVAAFNSLSDTDKSNVSQLINGDALLSDLVTTKGVAGTSMRQKLLQAAQAVDPTFNENTNKIRYDFNKKWNDPTTTVGTTRNAINTALGHLAELDNLSKKLPQNILQKMNSVDNVLNKNFGDSSVTDFRIALNALASELARTYKGGVPNEGEVKEWQQSLAENFSKKQFQGAFDTTASLLSSKVAATRYQYSSTMGKEYAQSLIDPDKKQALIDAGIDPSKIAKENVPGQDNTSPIAKQINTALSSVNQKTGQNYTAKDILDYLEKDPTWGTKVKAARATGKFTDDQIVSYIKSQ